MKKGRAYFVKLIAHGRKILNQTLIIWYEVVDWIQLAQDMAKYFCEYDNIDF
jgi:hypothetical protein